MRVLLTGSRGMLASAIRRQWADQRPQDEIHGLSRADVDLRDPDATLARFREISPDVVIHAAARVGGIAANVADPAGFLMDNLLLDQSVLRAAQAVGAPRLIYFGSSCMYPKDYRQPLVETDVLAAPLEPTNEGYALAKITAAKYCAYVSAQHGLAYKVLLPSNLYGPGDDYASGTSHLVAAAIAKVHAAKVEGRDVVDVWGDGTARREFTFVGDLAEWIVGAVDGMEDWPPLLNVGIGVDHSVLEIYELAARVVGWHGRFELDPSKPAGMKQKLMDSTRAAAFGWAPSTGLERGMHVAYAALSEGVEERR